MDIIEFAQKVDELAKKDPKLLALERDQRATSKMVFDVENYYDLKFPQDYIDFLKRYGGGYFGFTVVFSFDANGDFYIKNNISKQWTAEKNFLPFLDLETGDFIGFLIQNRICTEKIAVYSHEEGELSELNLDFYNVLLKYGLNLD